MVIFYCDLATQPRSIPELPRTVSAERIINKGQLRPADLQQMTSFWNPALACRKIKERFGLGASLWIIRFEEQLAGYGWTLRGGTVEPHFCRFGRDDVHLFDFYILPQYRGRGINPLLVKYILQNLAMESQEGRTFIEAAEWNDSQLASLTRRTPFHCLGSARKVTISGHTLVLWSQHPHQYSDEHSKRLTPIKSAG